MAVKLLVSSDAFVTFTALINVVQSEDTDDKHVENILGSE